MGQRPPVHLGSTNTLEYKPVPQEEGSIAPLARSPSTSFLNNRMMSCSHLDIKVPDVMEQGRMESKLKMVTPNHIQHKRVGCNASPLIKKFKKHINLKSCRCR